MSITLDDEQTQQIFLTLAESLEGGERSADNRSLVTYFQHPEDSIRRLAIEVIDTGERSCGDPSVCCERRLTRIWKSAYSRAKSCGAFRNPAAVGHLVARLGAVLPRRHVSRRVVALRERRAPEAVRRLAAKNQRRESQRCDVKRSLR